MKKPQKVQARGKTYNTQPPLVENMGEAGGRMQLLNGNFESFGASGRFDSKTASGDSCTLKRKVINLSSEGPKADAYGIPIDVFIISQMPEPEKMELRKRLKLELGQVKSIREKIASRDVQLTSSGSRQTVSNDYGSRMEGRCSESDHGKLGVGPFSGQTLGLHHQDKCLGSLKEKRTPKANQLYSNSEYVSCNDKMASSEKQKCKGGLAGLTGVKRGLVDKFEFRDGKKQRLDPVQSNKAVEQMKQCADILQKLMTHKFSWVFLEPVDPVELKIPDYFKIITNPMDLGTIKTKLERRRYLSPLEFAEDVRLTFSNAMKYNPPGNDVHLMAVTMKKLFENKWRAVEAKLAGEEVYKKITQGVQLHPANPTKKQQLKNKMAEIEIKSKTSSNANCIPISNVSSEQKPNAQPGKGEMSYDEKQKLSKDLEELSADMPEQIINFIREHSGLTHCEDEIEVDIIAFKDDTLWELRSLVTSFLIDRGQGAKVAHDAKPVDLPTNLRAGSQIDCQPPKSGHQGGDAGDEYVDVGGDDMPATNFPSVDIEKDTAASIHHSSSSGSSSSDSGSSSSGSDSESSSGSDSDAEEVRSADAPRKETVECPVGSKQMGQSDPETTGAFSVLDEEFAHPKAAASDADAHQEGESAPPERQVSPDKLHRVAMLRSRFADTILKAKEKTVNQVNKGDPEKIRREKEKLEKWQREEKARIHAEAKAAEAARKRAEAEAAAEAKRKREMEREAARLALQKMEKSVEIEENNQILKDLERLSYAPTDQISSSGDETSPVNSLDGFANFPLQGKNPLERLGLFMKSDEEDEETTLDCAAGNGDVEEGEID